MTTVTRAATALLPLAALFLPVLLPPAAVAASCREELDRFERELNESSLAALAPDLYAELARSAEEASELRDEELCMERVAELRSALADAEDSDAPPGAAPAPPLLLEPAPADYDGAAAAEGSELYSEDHLRN